MRHGLLNDGRNDHRDPGPPAPDAASAVFFSPQPATKSAATAISAAAPITLSDLLSRSLIIDFMGRQSYIKQSFGQNDAVRRNADPLFLCVRATRSGAKKESSGVHRTRQLHTERRQPVIAGIVLWLASRKVTPSRRLRRSSVKQPVRRRRSRIPYTTSLSGGHPSRAYSASRA